MDQVSNTMNRGYQKQRNTSEDIPLLWVNLPFRYDKFIEILCV